MKTKPFLTLSIVTVSVFALTLLVSSVSYAQDKAAEAAVSDSTEAAEDVSWDDNKGPRQKPFPDRPRSGDKRGPFADRPNHDRPPMEGFRPPREGARPGMDRPPMGGPQEGFRKPGSSRPEGRPEGPNRSATDTDFPQRWQNPESFAHPVRAKVCRQRCERFFGCESLQKHPCAFSF